MHLAKKKLKITSEICLFGHRPQNFKETSKTYYLQAQKKDYKSLSPTSL